MKLLAIFDNDGTLCDSQEAEGVCYGQAIQRIAGRTLESLDWTAYEEPTSSAMVRSLLGAEPAAAKMEQDIEAEYVALLQKARVHSPEEFRPLRGAVEFLKLLRAEGICDIAIATGCFTGSARFKLQCCGIDFDDYPHATSSDTPRRRDIIPLAAARAGHELSSVVYFGDAPWDVKAANLLGIPMIGIGRRVEQLRELGLAHAFVDYSKPRDILAALLSFKRASVVACKKDERT